jgi:hypothetical protein
LRLQAAARFTEVAGRGVDADLRIRGRDAQTPHQDRGEDTDDSGLPRQLQPQPPPVTPCAPKLASRLVST